MEIEEESSYCVCANFLEEKDVLKVKGINYIYIILFVIDVYKYNF